MAAAVADWHVTKEARGKIKKDASGKPPALELAENPDILATIGHLRTGRPKLVIGFAAETDDLLANAEKKLRKKGADWILANDVSPENGCDGRRRQHDPPGHGDRCRGLAENGQDRGRRPPD